MPFLLGLLAIVGGIVFWMYRVRGAAHTATDVIDMANDVRLAARRFGFRRRSNQHPAETFDDPNVAVAGIAAAFLELNGFPTQEDKSALQIALAKHAKVSGNDANDLLVLGNWLVGQCNGPFPAITRLSKTLYKSSKSDEFQKVMSIIKDIAKANDNELTLQQKEALQDIQQGFKIS